MARLGLGYDAVWAINPGRHLILDLWLQPGRRAVAGGRRDDINYQPAPACSPCLPGQQDAPSIPPALVAARVVGEKINILLPQQHTPHQRGLPHRRRDDRCHVHLRLARPHRRLRGRTRPRITGEHLHQQGAPPPRYALSVHGQRQVPAAGEPKFWAAFCHGVGLPERLRDDRANPRRQPHRDHGLHQTTAERYPSSRSTAARQYLSSLEEAVDDPRFSPRGLVRSPSRRARSGIRCGHHRADRGRSAAPRTPSRTGSADGTEPGWRAWRPLPRTVDAAFGAGTPVIAWRYGGRGGLQDSGGKEMKTRAYRRRGRARRAGRSAGRSRSPPRRQPLRAPPARSRSHPRSGP